MALPPGDNFSKIVRSLLLDVDVHLDQLEQIGYLSKEQRSFVDQFLYKNEDALRAVRFFHLYGAESASEPQITKAVSSEGIIPRVLVTCPTDCNDGAKTVNSHYLPRLRAVTEQLQPEEKGLSAFLKRCNARNFSVQVKSSNPEKDLPSKAIGSEYVSRLELITEGPTRDNINNDKANREKDKVGGNVSHDTNMMVHGVTAMKLDFDAQPDEFEDGVQTDYVSKPNSDQVEHRIIEAVTIGSGKDGPHLTENIDFIASTVVCNEFHAAVKPPQLDMDRVELTDFKMPETLENNDEAVGTKLDRSSVVKEHGQSLDSNHRSNDPITLSPAADIESEPETNAWGKRLRPDPTRNKEGAIVGASAKPLGLDNRGKAMMEKMGWRIGTGLGKQNAGILEPVAHVVKNTKAGLRSADEKKQKAIPITYSIEKSQSPLLDPDTEQKLFDSASRQEWDTTADNPDWDKPTEAMIEKVRQDAREIEIRRLAAIPPFIGIKALYLREGDNLGPERNLSFNARIMTTNEQKTILLPPGIVIKALSPQGSYYTNSKNDRTFKVSGGSHLEVLRLHRGNEFHVYNFRSRRRGIVKISLLEILDEPKVGPAGMTHLTVNPNVVSAWV